MRVDVYTAMNHLQLRQVLSIYLKNRCVSPLDVRKTVCFPCFFPMAEFPQEEECTQLLYAVQVGLEDLSMNFSSRWIRFCYRRDTGIDDNDTKSFRSCFSSCSILLAFFWRNVQFTKLRDGCVSGKTEEAHLGCTKSCHSSTARGSRPRWIRCGGAAWWRAVPPSSCG